MKKDKSLLPFVLFSSKEKCCWCKQNYLWHIWWKCYETCANWFKQFKNGNFDINDKECSGRPTAMEEDKLRKDGKKS